MKKVFFGAFFLLGMLCAPLFSNAQTSNNQQVSDEIINLVKAQWAAMMNEPSNSNEQFKNTADDYTEFNGDFATRIEGKALAVRLSEAGTKGPGKILAAEMLNPKVQSYGDVAILTYNYAGVVSGKDGDSKPVRAKSSRVYVKQGGKWKLVHANFAPDPLPND
jgi:ketosteroid isomerase-like protein